MTEFIIVTSTIWTIICCVLSTLVIFSILNELDPGPYLKFFLRVTTGLLTLAALGNAHISMSVMLRLLG